MDPDPLKKAIKGLQAIVDLANTLVDSQDGIRTLAEKPGSVFCPAIKIYSDLLNSYSLSEMKNFDNNLKKNPKLDEVAEEFWDIEDCWDEVLAKIDVKINKADTGEICKVGDLGPLEADFIDIKNEEKQTKLENVLIDNQDSKVHLVLLRHLS